MNKNLREVYKLVSVYSKRVTAMKLKRDPVYRFRHWLCFALRNIAEYSTKKIGLFTTDLHLALTGLARKIYRGESLNRRSFDFIRTICHRRNQG